MSDDTVDVSLYVDAGTVPGAQIFHQAGIPLQFSNSPVIPLTGLALPPGSYWLSIQAKGAHQWTWSAFHPPAHGDEAVWRNPADGYGKGCTAYTPLSTCFFSTPASDFTFRLNGNVASNLFTLGKARSRANGTARLPATFPAPGEVTLLSGGGSARSRAARVRLKTRR